MGSGGSDTHRFAAGLYASTVPTALVSFPPPIAYTQLPNRPAMPGHGAVVAATDRRGTGNGGSATHRFVAGLNASTVFPVRPPMAYTHVPLSPATPDGHAAVAPAMSIRPTGSGAVVSQAP
ncbi:hypothetical protein Slala02_70670 [Streptomyces lavendulae subsp. lavendulae]|nr:MULTISPECIES: hypothetical protein [Streptomyces]GLX23456.1 hypothetical protein Slala01_71000 [Streptomyces lavendulae subsp. lavendulae]GLX31248.1 hypothetical protein Slala02_70670 [Streptomyces lavendulae subsp. lavendulae]